MFYNLKMEIENKALLKAYRHSKYLEQKLKTHLDVQTQNRLNYINIDFKPQIVKTKQDVARDYYFLNRELKLDYKSLYDAENKTKNREYAKNYYQRNKVELLAKSKICYELNKDAISKYNRQYIIDNEERLHLYRVKYYNDKKK